MKKLSFKWLNSGKLKIGSKCDRGKCNSSALCKSGQTVNLSAPMGEVARSTEGEISRRDKKFEFCHSEMQISEIQRFALNDTEICTVESPIAQSMKRLKCHKKAAFSHHNDSNVIASTNESGFADGRSKASPDSEKIEQTATKLQLRNFSSVEQIQDSECAAIQKNSYRNDWIASSDLRPPRNDGGKYCSYCSSPEGDTSSSKRGTSFARLHAGSDSESQVRWGASHAAFTLIEVLLACVIVGVISALVLPVFVSKYRQKSFDLGFERMTKTLNNALDNLIVTENKGSYFSTMMYVSEEPETYESNSGQFIKKYLKLSKYCGDSNRDCFANIYYKYENKDKSVYNPEFKGACGSLKNGSSICLTPQISANSPQVLIDINGKKGPNVLGQDLRTFSLNLKTRTAINTQTQDVIVPPPYDRGNTDEPEIDPPEPPSDPCETDPNSLGCCQKKAADEIFADEICCTYSEIKNSNTNCGQEMRVTVEVIGNNVKLTGLIEGLGVHIGVQGCLADGGFLRLHSNGTYTCNEGVLINIAIMDNSDNKFSIAYSEYGDSKDTRVGNSLRFCRSHNMNPCTMAFIVTKNKNYPYIKFVRTEDTSTFND